MQNTNNETNTNTEDKKWWVNEVGDLMWRPESPGPDWQLGMEWVDED
jgi:hypothetical protein